MCTYDFLKGWNILKADILELEGDFEDTLLTEDMFQIENGNHIIDSGWYSAQNAFITHLIYMHDWENPVVKFVSSSLRNCIHAIELTVTYANKLAVDKPLNCPNHA